MNGLYGSVAPLKARTSGLARSPWAIFAASFGAGLVVFFAVIAIINFHLFFHQNEVVGLIEFLLILDVALIWKNRSGMERRSPLLLPTAVNCAVAIVMGSVLGVYCYGHYGFYSSMYANTRIYHNVVPSEIAASMMDAGRLVFAPEARVDTAKAQGYSQIGSVYCAAPVRGIEEPRQVEFWAVGMGCCGQSGTFTCDAAKDQVAPSNDTAAPPSDGKEHGGVIVFETNSLFGSRAKDHYDLARMKAEAAANLTSAEEYIYLRWVSTKEVASIVDDYNSGAWTFIGLATLFWALMLGPMTWLSRRE